MLDRVGRAGNRFYDRIRRGDAMKAAEGEPAARGFGHLKGHTYCIVVSYKRDGTPVPTPVWFGLDDEGRLYFRAFTSAAKLRRIKNDPRVLIAPCTMRGKPLGPSAPGTARILGEHDEHAEAAIQSNYGLFRRTYESTAGAAEGRYVEVTPA